MLSFRPSTIACGDGPTSHRSATGTIITSWHPGLDPGSKTSAPQWIAYQVRYHENRKLAACDQLLPLISASQMP